MAERYPNLQEEVRGSIPGCELWYILDIILAMWSYASCALALACHPSVSKNKKIKKYKVARYEDTCHKNDPWIGLIKEAKYDMTLNILFSVIWLFMSLWWFFQWHFYELVNKYCHWWWMSSYVGQNPTFSCQQLVINILSWMIKIWMKHHLVSVSNCNIVNL